MADDITIRPQPGPQEQFLASSADICIYGGAAGGGKTYGLLLEPIRHLNVPKYRGVIFRRTTPEITKPGGLWDEAVHLYSYFSSDRRESPQHEIKFPKGGSLSFAHLQYEDTKLDWKSAQLAFLAFDQLETFTEGQFFYLLSRNRTDCGVAPYVRCTCNPDPDSWLAGFLSWWIDQDTGLPIPERSGQARWMVRISDQIVWGDTKAELEAKYPKSFPLSVMFIKAEFTDNKINLQRNPNYEGWLNSLSLVDRERLKHGNWKIRESAGTMFKRHWFGIVGATPAKATRCRMWDMAGTTASENPGADETASILLSKTGLNMFFVEDCNSFKGSDLEVEQAILNTAQQDGKEVTIGLFQDPGQAGKGQARRLARMLAGYQVKIITANKDTGKIIMAKPVSAQAEARNIYLKRAQWNDLYLTRMDNFPEGKLKDVVDAMSGAFKILTEASGKWASGDC